MILKPPSNINQAPTNALKVFLAGSIEQDSASRWQDRIAERLVRLGFVVFNPRREAWDSSWSQTFEDANFSQQVHWELDAIQAANLVLFFFEPETQSPISLMELGFMAGLRKQNVIVVCPEGFWRKGNVDILCYREGIMQVKSLDDAVSLLSGKMIEHENKN